MSETLDQVRHYIQIKLYLYLSILLSYIYILFLLRNRKQRVMLRRNVSSLYINDLPEGLS